MQKNAPYPYQYSDEHSKCISAVCVKSESKK